MCYLWRRNEQCIYIHVFTRESHILSCCVFWLKTIDPESTWLYPGPQHLPVFGSEPSPASGGAEPSFRLLSVGLRGASSHWKCGFHCGPMNVPACLWEPFQEGSRPADCSSPHSIIQWDTENQTKTDFTYSAGSALKKQSDQAWLTPVPCLCHQKRVKGSIPASRIVSDR